ncbi:hypothetical protein HYW21_08875 [Candidatus Woesearchaeota archaeon]|nr:hypothetical protein [Candidatus Woesearchaeota archaeon]
MPMYIILTVELVVPDTTALTTLQTLQRMGYTDLKELKRRDYYLFTVDGDEKHYEAFSKRLQTTDVLVNVNKHRATTTLIRDKHPETQTPVVLITAREDDAQGLLKTLQERLGMHEIRKVKKGVLWEFIILGKSGKNVKAYAERMTKALLYNEHYQTYEMW